MSDRLNKAFIEKCNLDQINTDRMYDNTFKHLKTRLLYRYFKKGIELALPQECPPSLQIKLLDFTTEPTTLYKVLRMELLGEKAITTNL